MLRLPKRYPLLLACLLSCSNGEPVAPIAAPLTVDTTAAHANGGLTVAEARVWQPYPSYAISEEERLLILETLRAVVAAPPNASAETLKAIADLVDVEPTISAVVGPIDGPIQYYVDIKGRELVTRWIVDLDARTGTCEFDGVLEFLVVRR